MSNIFKYPIKNFVSDLASVDADGCLVVDAPHELREENELRNLMNKKFL